MGDLHSNRSKVAMDDLHSNRSKVAALTRIARLVSEFWPGKLAPDATRLLIENTVAYLAFDPRDSFDVSAQVIAETVSSEGRLEQEVSSSLDRLVLRLPSANDGQVIVQEPSVVKANGPTLLKCRFYSFRRKA